MTRIGSRQWNDIAEMSEWDFMARVMREAKDRLPMNFSPLGVAIDIADARAKSGWRTAPDDDFAPDQTAEIARLQALLENAIDHHYAAMCVVRGNLDDSYKPMAEGMKSACNRWRSALPNSSLRGHYE